jgi:polyprenyl P-hydroxybenzoate/phenylacrylic acid decarboxylase-like protein
MTSLEPAPSRLIVGISGASGVLYGVRLLQLLRNAGVETHLVMSKTAEITFAHETTLKIADVKALAHTHHRIDDMAASISSGSFRTTGMIIAPCSIRSMSEIATGVTTTLLTRAADVTLKERRRLVLMVRETPLHTDHRASGTGFLCQAGHHRRHGGSHRGTRTRSVRDRCRRCQPLGRAVRIARPSAQAGRDFLSGLRRCR